MKINDVQQQNMMQLTYLTVFLFFLFSSQSQVYYKFPDIVKCQSTSNPNQYYIFWMNDYSDTYIGYRYIVGAAENLGIFFNDRGQYIYGIGNSFYYRTCIGKSLQELKNLNWTFTLENSKMQSMSIILQALKQQLKVSIDQNQLMNTTLRAALSAVKNQNEQKNNQIELMNTTLRAALTGVKNQNEQQNNQIELMNKTLRAALSAVENLNEQQNNNIPSKRFEQVALAALVISILTFAILFAYFIYLCRKARNQDHRQRQHLDNAGIRMDNQIIAANRGRPRFDNAGIRMDSQVIPANRSSSRQEISEMGINLQESSIVGINTCCICHQRLNADIQIIPCGHGSQMHPGCLRGWAERNRTCPICRAGL